MDETLVTIPGATAHHVLGQSSVTLGAGDLSLLPASDGGKDLMLTVGSAGFALHKDTKFGTLEGDLRAYVFAPDIDGTKGGFVKITLPEGVTVDGSQLSALQMKFEQVLIAHGLLRPGGESGEEQATHAAKHAESAIALQSGEALVSIPGVAAVQVLGNETRILSEGTLSLVLMPETDSDGEPLLTIVVGQSAFPLYRTTAFGTLATDSRTYVFTPDVEGANKGFVAIILPETAFPNTSASDSESLQNDFELVLIQYGLLKDGFSAAADELARSVREDAARAVQHIRDAHVEYQYLETHPESTAYPASGSRHAIADVAHELSGAVKAARAWIASTFEGTDAETTAQLNDASEGAEDMAGGVGTAVREMQESLKDATGDVLENDYGEDAREVSSDFGESMVNVGAVAEEASTATSKETTLAAESMDEADRQNEEQNELDELAADDSDELEEAIEVIEDGDIEEEQG